MRKTVYVLVIILFVVGAPIAYVGFGNIPALAKICNLEEWKISETEESGPLICLTLTYRYMIARGPGGIPAIKRSLPYSLNLRRLVPMVIQNWPSQDTRQIAVELLRDPDERVAMNAAYALGKLGGPEVYDPLLKALDHRIPMVRHNALNALNELGQADLAVDATINILTNPREEVSVAMSAIALLEHLEDNVNRRKAIVALRRFMKITTIEYRKDDADHAVKKLETLIRLTTG